MLLVWRRPPLRIETLLQCEGAGGASCMVFTSDKMNGPFQSRVVDYKLNVCGRPLFVKMVTSFIYDLNQ